MDQIERPSKEQLLAARGKTIPDVIAPDLRILFCGINPSLYSAAVGHHFARPGNRFWPALHAARMTPRLYSPFADQALIALGLGITNVVARATAAADELSSAELVTGGQQLLRKLVRYRPHCLVVLGIVAFRQAFARPAAALGEQQEPLGQSRVWVLPNPSGLNAHHPLADLARRLRAVDRAMR
ncbi:MAG: G/U mismatch-specific DNA glycosylase [Planctomycetota bacterium]